MNHIENFVGEEIMPKDKDYYDEEELRSMGFKSVGIDVRVSKLAIIKNPNEVSLGNHVAIDPYVIIATQAEIGNYIHIANATVVLGSVKSKLVMEDFSFTSSHCTLVCGTDDYVGEALANPTIPLKYRKLTFGTTIFRKFSGIGANTVTMPNITIGEGTVTGACALITKSLDPWGIYLGVPAKRFRDRRRDVIERFAKEIEEGNNAR